MLACDALWLHWQRPNREHRIENRSLLENGSKAESRFNHENVSVFVYRYL